MRARVGCNAGYPKFHFACLVNYYYERCRKVVHGLHSRNFHRARDVFIRGFDTTKNR